MPFNGTGTFTLVSGNPVVTGTNISSTVQNNTMSDFANAFTNCITRDGQSAPTSNLPMGNRRHTEAGSATGAGEYLVYGQALNGTDLTLSGDLVVGDDATVTGDLTAATIAIASGAVVPVIYTPTVTNLANTSAGVSNGTWKCTRSGNVVTFAGSLSFTITLQATLTRLRVSLPVPSTFAASTDAGGVGVSSNTSSSGMPGPAVYANTATADLRVESTSGSTAAGASITVWVSGSYEII